MQGPERNKRMKSPFVFVWMHGNTTWYEGTHRVAFNSETISWRVRPRAADRRNVRQGVGPKHLFGLKERTTPTREGATRTERCIARSSGI